MHNMQHILLTIYNSLIQTTLYGLYRWGLNCKRLKILQKKAFRQYISHSTPKFKTLKILKLEDFICSYIRFITKIPIIYYHHISIASHFTP